MEWDVFLVSFGVVCFCSLVFLGEYSGCVLFFFGEFLVRGFVKGG